MKWSEARREEQGQTGREKPGWQRDPEKERDSGGSGRARSGQGGGEGLVGADREKEAGETDGHPDPRWRRPKRAGVGEEGGACAPRAGQGQRRARHGRLWGARDAPGAPGELDLSFWTVSV